MEVVPVTDIRAKQQNSYYKWRASDLCGASISSKHESEVKKAKRKASFFIFFFQYRLCPHKNALRHALVADNAFKDIRTSVRREINIYNDLYNKLYFSIKLVIADV